MAVYTEVTTEQLAGFLADYNVGSATSLKGLIEGVENTNYFLATDKGEYILTLYEQRVNPDDLPFFMHLLEHLGAKGFPCPPPLTNQSGKTLATLAGKPAALFPFLQGVSSSAPNIPQCREVGRHLAKMHLACADFPQPWRKNSMAMAEWQTLFDACRDSAEGVAPGLTQEIAQVLEEAANHWPQELPRGIGHTDLFCDNVLFTGTKITGVIDFYFACEELLVYDLAVTLNAWSVSPYGSFYYSNSRALLQGYQEYRAITPEERDAFILMLRTCCVRFLLTRIYDWINTPQDAVVRRKDPMEYVRALRLHLKQDSPTFYGFDEQ